MIGVVEYQEGQRATHVIVSGNIFPWIDKQPFTLSGHSTEGAVEYDRNSDAVKCHACGEWVKDIPSHVAAKKRSGSSTHSTIRKFRIRHGFKLSNDPLAIPSVNENRKKIALRDGNAERLKSQSRTALQKAAKTRIVKPQRQHYRFTTSTANLTMRCRAQKLAELRVFATEIGRTPTARELKAFKNSSGYGSLHPGRLEKLFDSPLFKIILEAGLKPRVKEWWKLNPRWASK